MSEDMPEIMSERFRKNVRCKNVRSYARTNVRRYARQNVKLMFQYLPENLSDRSVIVGITRSKVTNFFFYRGLLTKQEQVEQGTNLGFST